MVAVAAEAGASRRLVYDHFPDLPALCAALFDDRSSRYLDSIDRAAESDGSVDLFTRAFEHLLVLPADDQRVLHHLVVGAVSPELEPLQTRFRNHVEQRWLPDLPVGHRVVARAVLWSITCGLFSLADTVMRGELSPADAIEIARALVKAAPGFHPRVAAAAHHP